MICFLRVLFTVNVPTEAPGERNPPLFTATAPLIVPLPDKVPPERAMTPPANEPSTRNVPLLMVVLPV